MSRSSDPSWYYPGDVPRTLREARQYSTVSDEDLVSVLAEREFEAPREQVAEIVQATPEDLEPSNEASSQGSLADPRPNQKRILGVEDIPYFSTGDFATVLGAALSRYEGNFRAPDDVDSLDVDLFYNQQHTTTALRTVPNERGQLVGKEVLKHVIRGNTSPQSGRSPSVVGVVTNTGFTDAAEELGDNRELQLFGRDYVARWFRDAQLTMEVVGYLLDEGERSEEERETALEELPPLPEPVQDREPLFADTPPIQITGGVQEGKNTERKEKSERRRSIPRVDTPSAAGQRGELYADPEEDGDFGAFDDYIDALDPEEEQ